MGNLVNHAKEELRRIGYCNDNADDYNTAIADAVIEIIELFGRQGHSGMSASIVMSLIEPLMNFKPLSPLTGDDDEWMHVGDQNGGPLYQNKRHSTVFKDVSGAYDIDGIVFWEWYEDPKTKERHKSYYTSSDSRVPVTFPYTVPKHPKYKYRSENR